MIVVLADDFSGAAEIGGVALRYGLSVEIRPDIGYVTDCQVLIIDSNTRTDPVAEAGSKIGALTRQISLYAPVWIYKKIDSVLRGHIIAELQAMVTVLQKKGALIVPANPSQGRIIRDGNYYVNGMPLDLTDFSADPDFPRRTAKISELLNSEDTIKIIPSNEQDMDIGTGLIIGEAGAPKDIRRWADRVTPDLLPAGAADFFAAILEKKKHAKKKTPVPGHYKAGKNRLIISGSLASPGVELVSRPGLAKYADCPLVLNMVNREEKFQKKMDRWVEQIVTAFNQKDHVVAYIPKIPEGRLAGSPDIAGSISAMVHQVIHQVTVDELIIEGGSTASRILCSLGWQRLKPVLELAPGVVVLNFMELRNLQVVVKPGSYEWPEILWTNRPS